MVKREFNGSGPESELCEGGCLSRGSLVDVVRGIRAEVVVLSDPPRMLLTSPVGSFLASD